MAKSKARKAAPQASGGVETKKDLSPKVPQRDKIGFELAIRQRDDLTDKQKQLIDLILARETRVVMLAGPAGTSKTYVSVLAGLMLMQKRAISDILYVRSVIESASRSLGFLPGEQQDKMEPYLRPLRDKLEEILPVGNVATLIKDKRCEGVPVNYLRGASFNARFILIDEAQNYTEEELLTILTRTGKFSKVIVAGDFMQSDIGARSGFQKIFDLFNDEESKGQGIHCFVFTRDDIVRSEIVRFIVEKFERARAGAKRDEPMFPPR